MISAVCWAPREAAQSTPIKFELLQEELAKLSTKDAEEEEDNKNVGADGVEGSDNSEADEEEELDSNGLPASLNMDTYDDEKQEKAIRVTGEQDLMEEMEMNVGDTAAMQEMEKIEEDSEDKEDFELKPTDRIVVVAHTDEDYSCLEVQIYDEETQSLYVHHDISLPAFPLCVSWVGCDSKVLNGATSTSSKNYVAVGTFHPGIEIWNLDVLDVIEPNVTLGGSVDSNAGQDPHGVLGHGKLKEGSHTDAVMGISWNSVNTNLFASGSADKTVKLWDISTQQCVHTFNHHKDKVQSVVWNSSESHILLSGSFDQSLAVFDARQGDSAEVINFSVSADVECAVWDPHNGAHFYVSSEDGKVSCFDVRSNKGAVFSFKAHLEPCSALSISPNVAGLMATCSPDKSVKVWDLRSSMSKGGKPALVCQKTMALGGIYDCSFSVDDPYLIAAGGDQGILGLWDIAEEEGVKNAFSK